MSTQDIVEAWEHEKEAKGFEKGFEKGYREGLIEGLVLAYCARFGPIPQEVQRLLEATHDWRTLEGWYALISTVTASSFVDAVRAAQR